MRVKFEIILMMFFLISCNTQEGLVVNYYCSCNNDFSPRYVVKINKNKFQLYSANIAGEKYIGKSEIKGDVLFLYRTHDLVNNFRDTLTSIDTLKFVIKGRKLIPFKNEVCFLKKTNDKKKLFQLPYIDIDTTRAK